MLTDNELILLGLETEMERVSNDFKSFLDHFRIDDDKIFSRIVECREQYKLLEARHDALVTDTHEVPF